MRTPCLDLIAISVTTITLAAMEDERPKRDVSHSALLLTRLLINGRKSQEMRLDKAASPRSRPPLMLQDGQSSGSQGNGRERTYPATQPPRRGAARFRRRRQFLTTRIAD